MTHKVETEQKLDFTEETQHEIGDASGLMSEIRAMASKTAVLVYCDEALVTEMLYVANAMEVTQETCHKFLRGLDRRHDGGDYWILYS